MTIGIKVQPSLMSETAAIVSKKPNIAQLDMPLGLFVPRFDAFISEKCKADGTDPNDIDMSDYTSAGLLGVFRWMQKYKYFGRFGHTVNVIKHILEFPSTELSILWIPKNSCTSIKNLLLQFEPESAKTGIKKNRFHETVQQSFGTTVQRLARDEMFPMMALVRHPYERLVSCYIDKFAMPVLRDRNFESFAHHHIRRAHMFLGIEDRDVGRSISFREFVAYIELLDPWQFDSHWRPQADFLCGISARGTEFIKSNNFGLAAERVGVKEAGPRHNISTGKSFDPTLPLTGIFTDLLPEQIDISKMKFYNDVLSEDLVDSLVAIYAEDVALFEAAL